MTGHKTPWCESCGLYSVPVENGSCEICGATVEYVTE